MHVRSSEVGGGLSLYTSTLYSCDASWQVKAESKIHGRVGPRKC